MNRNARRLLLFVLMCGLSSPQWAESKPTGKSVPPVEEKPLAPSGRVDAVFNDESTLKLAILDTSLELTTDFGKLTIPMRSVHRIEFGLRIPKQMEADIRSAIAELGSAEFDVREKATKKLLARKEKAYPAVKRATEDKDAEVSRRAREVLKQFEASLSKELRNLPEYDVVHTAKSKIAGRVEGEAFQARTQQFGEVRLRLSDVRRLTFREFVPPFDMSQVVPAPQTIFNLKDRVGQVFYFRVTGVNIGGSLWGTGVYTADSSLPMAAVHVGAVKIGEAGIVKVTIVAPPAVFLGSTQNGITSGGYNNYPGAYRVEAVQVGR